MNIVNRIFYTIYGHCKGGAHLFTFFWSFACVESYSELVMIDISQWRANIGLWYYQICDNSIDKSVLSKKWTRAKHRKQLSNEATEQGNSSETPAVQSDGQTPAVQSDGQTPAVQSDGQTPAVQSDGQTPAVQSDGQTPAVQSDGQTPAVQSDGQTPAVQSDGQTPAVQSDGQTPAVQSDGQTPVILSNSSTANTTMRYADWCGRVQTISLAVFLFLLLILSGDIELNPGPKTGK